MKFFRQKYLFIVFVLCFAFSLAIYNTIVNGHFHTDAFGRIIFHAHPSSDGSSSDRPFKGHFHSKLALLIYETITSLIFLLVFVLCLFGLIFPVHEGLLIFVQIFTPYSLTILPFRRGPPSF